MSSEYSVESILLLEGIFLKYGYDFRQYSEQSVQRRIESVILKYGLSGEMELLSLILKDPHFFRSVLSSFTVTTTELFRDPPFYSSLRQNVIPVLKTHPTLNIWIAGCSTGEEIYSLAILLHEEGLLERSTIYATDINPAALKAAQDGIYSLEGVRTFTKNYVQAGGKASPSDYYSADYSLARFRSSLRKNVVFAEHNLTVDGVFTEAHLILCRNVMIYFNRELQTRVFDLFYKSLSPRGYLGLGTKETLRFSNLASSFDSIDSEMRIYKKNPLIARNESSVG